jgi:hypothetical protein
MPVLAIQIVIRGGYEFITFRIGLQGIQPWEGRKRYSLHGKWIQD